MPPAWAGPRPAVKRTSEQFYMLPARIVRAVAGIRHGIEVLGCLSSLPWADRGGWRGSVRQLAGKLAELTGHTWNRDRLTKTLRALVDAGALVLEKAGRWWTVFRLLRPQGVSTLEENVGVQPPLTPPERTPVAVPPPARPAELPGRERHRGQGQGSSALASVVGALLGTARKTPEEPVPQGYACDLLDVAPLAGRALEERRRLLLEQARKLSSMG